MSDNIEMAQQGLEHAHGEHARGEAGGHAVAHAPDRGIRRAAVLIAVLAAGAVIAEMSTNDAQTGYLTAHIAASDSWTQYQAKSVRHTVLAQSAMALDAAGQAAAAANARTEAARMQSEPGGDGMEQLAERAHGDEARREREFLLHEKLERGTRGLQIAIVLTSLFMVTRAGWLFAAGAGLGAVAGCYAIAAGFALL